MNNGGKRGTGRSDTGEKAYLEELTLHKQPDIEMEKSCQIPSASPDIQR